MKLTPQIALEVASHEAIIRQAYKDSVGIWTWSVGLTNASGHNVERYIGKPQSLEHCLSIFVWALERYADDVLEEFDGYTLTVEQFTAALSFHWNTGEIKKASWVRRWKGGDTKGARAAFMWYRKPKSIIERRKRERDLFFDGRWHNNGTMTEFTRVTSRSTPDWKSGATIDVSDTLERMLAAKTRKAPPSRPTARSGGLAAFFKRIFGRK
jgi:GH24 family phage-related lysozyme (muramidase)